MEGIACKRCGGTKYVKRGFVRGLQRYLCKGCGCNFTATPARGKPAAMKALAVLLYAMGNASQGRIARLLKVSHVAVYKWIRAEAEELPEPSATNPRPGSCRLTRCGTTSMEKKQDLGLAGL